MDKSSKPQGWFSRRHQSPEAHTDAYAKYAANRGADSRAEVAGRNGALRSVRTPQEQIAALDNRLGKNLGAARERARLANLTAN